MVTTTSCSHILWWEWMLKLKGNGRVIAVRQEYQGCGQSLQVSMTQPSRLNKRQTGPERKEQSVMVAYLLPKYSVHTMELLQIFAYTASEFNRQLLRKHLPNSENRPKTILYMQSQLQTTVFISCGCEDKELIIIDKTCSTCKIESHASQVRNSHQ